MQELSEEDLDALAELLAPLIYDKLKDRLRSVVDQAKDVSTSAAADVIAGFLRDQQKD